MFRKHHHGAFGQQVATAGAIHLNTDRDGRVDCAGRARSQLMVAREISRQIVLLGDFIFDNGVYVPG